MKLTERQYAACARRAQRSQLGSWAVAPYGDRSKIGHPVTEFVPAECWMTSDNRRQGATYHRVDFGAAVWVTESAPIIAARALCGASYGVANFHTDVPDDAESICDACLFIDGGIPIVVYRFFDADCALLYVGSTTNFITRVGQHRTSTPWWSEVAYHTLVEYDTYAAALAAEGAAIRVERPIYNIHKQSKTWLHTLATVAA